MRPSDKSSAKAHRRAPSLTPWQILEQLGRIQSVAVWFELRDGRQMWLTASILTVPRGLSFRPPRAVVHGRRRRKKRGVSVGASGTATPASTGSCNSGATLQFELLNESVDSSTNSSRKPGQVSVS